jgi:hypothetical protein
MTATPTRDLAWLLYRLRVVLSNGARLGDHFTPDRMREESRKTLLQGISAALELLADPQQLLTDDELVSALEARELISTLLEQLPADALIGALARKGHLLLDTTPDPDSPKPPEAA